VFHSDHLGTCIPCNRGVPNIGIWQLMGLFFQSSSWTSGLGRGSTPPPSHCKRLQHRKMKWNNCSRWTVLVHCKRPHNCKATALQQVSVRSSSWWAICQVHPMLLQHGILVMQLSQHLYCLKVFKTAMVYKTCRGDCPQSRSYNDIVTTSNT